MEVEKKDKGEKMTKTKKHDIIKKVLTNESDGLYTESLKTVKAAFAPVTSDFFVSLWGMRAENNQYRPEHSLTAFSESPANSIFGGLLRKVKDMTNTSIQKIHELRMILEELYENTECSYIATRCSEVRKELAQLTVDILDVDAMKREGGYV